MASWSGPPIVVIIGSTTAFTIAATTATRKALARRALQPSTLLSRQALTGRGGRDFLLTACFPSQGRDPAQQWGFALRETRATRKSGASDRACAIRGKKPSWHGLGDLRRADRLIFVKVSYVFQR
jgi:hypothetical protein